MPRSVNAVASRKRRKRMLAKAKGYWGRRSKVTTVAKHSVEKAGQHAYSGRKLKKRVMRNIWTVRINAAARDNNTTYSKLIGALHKKNIDINRKVLAQLAYDNPPAFSEVVKFALS
ncbi:MAG: 50S ribosomal protein L20 [Ignavibacteria bacterium]|nr:50S ribosomal protein L20 [Ignavibacteria bacterium]HMT10599.1 50S ribosomal protein L20 [Ignavibacteria bacterium]